jgi:hypothetical protein
VGQCILDTLGQTPAGAPTRQCLLVPTNSIPWDNCDCGGQLALAIQSVYGSEKFPGPASGISWTKCSPRWIVAQVMVSVTRCVPTMDESGNPPLCSASLAAAITLENDRTAVRQAIACCLRQIYEATPWRVGQWLLGPSQTVGELGGCAGVETTFLIGVQLCPCPD